MKKIFFLSLFILLTGVSFSQNQRLVHRFYIQSTYKKDTALVNVAKNDQKVKLLIDSAERYRKRILPKLILSGALYGLSLSQLPKEYAYINDVPLQDYRSMERKSSLTLLISGIVFFSSIKPIIFKDYYISKAYDSAHLKNPYIPYISKSVLKKISLKKFKKSYLKYRIIKIGQSRTEFDNKVQFPNMYGSRLRTSFRIDVPKVTSNFIILDSNKNNVSIRCCNELPIDYYFVNNQLSEFKVDDSVLKSTFIKYNRYIDSLQIQQQKRRQIIKQKR